MKKISELRNLTIEELNKELLAMRRDQFNLRMQKANGTLDKTHPVAEVRKTIARINTLITEKRGIENGN